MISPLAAVSPTRSTRRSQTTPAATSGASDQRELAIRVLEGESEAVTLFTTKIRPDVEAYLIGQSWSARTRNLAREVIDDLMSECFGGFATAGKNSKKKTPLLLGYRGGSTLKHWLKRIARNRLISTIRSKAERDRVDLGSAWESNEFISVAEGGEDDAAGFLEAQSAVPPTLLPHSERKAPGRNPLRGALADALRKLGENHPDQLVLLELHFLHGVKKNILASSWGVEPSTIGRRIDRALDRLRQHADLALDIGTPKAPNASRPAYTVEDFLEAGCIGTLRYRALQAA